MARISLSLLAILAVLLSSVGVRAQGASAALRGGDPFQALVKQCAPNIAPSTLSAVVEHESGFNPLTININGPDKLPRQPYSVEEAVATAKYLDAQGYNFDVGVGQINSRNIHKYKVDWRTAFLVCSNLRLAATILTDCYARASAGQHDPQLALRDALSCYNTGTFDRGLTNGYVGQVEQAAGIAPDVQVPPLRPLPAGKAAQLRASVRNAASAAMPTTGGDDDDQAPAMRDVFANAMGDAFDRAALEAREADAPTTTKTAPTKAPPVVLTGQSGSQQ